MTTYTRSIQSTVSITESVHRVKTASFSDTLSVTDGSSPPLSHSLSDNVSFTQSLLAAFESNNISDHVSITDFLTTTNDLYRELYDCLYLGEKLNKSITESIADTIILVEGINDRELLGDIIVFTEDIDINAEYSCINRIPDRAFSETLTVTDSIALTKVSKRSLSDTLVVGSGVFHV